MRKLTERQYEQLAVFHHEGSYRNHRVLQQLVLERVGRIYKITESGIKKYIEEHEEALRELKGSQNSRWKK
jgi:hypothetical protein